MQPEAIYVLYQSEWNVVSRGTVFNVCLGTGKCKVNGMHFRENDSEDTASADSVLAFCLSGN